VTTLAWIAAGIGLSTICGALGAVVTWWFLGQASISLGGAAIFVGWLVTLIGWFANARLSERAQRRMFRHNLVNTARGEIVKAVRETQDWLSQVNGLAAAAHVGFKHQRFVNVNLPMQIRRVLISRRFWRIC